ncbi:MAG TPA: inositol monophosphatase family protein [Candidatus Limnocylindrales bacterium]|nr:inositol monophosphatase family protein [Candidatus Limnocylindrales bacterium]
MDDVPATGVEWSATRRRGDARELDEWLSFCHATCDEADAIALGAFRTELGVDRKADGSYVTAADRAVERTIRDRIASRYPAHGLVGEEYGEAEAGTGGERWYIDPIDGTHNFMRGLPLFATLIAVERDGEIQVGMISAPALGQRWWAMRGGGAWVAGGPANPDGPRRLAVSNVERLDASQVLFRSIRDMEASRVAAGFERLIHAAWRERGFGDFWGYTLIADGTAEAMLEQDLHPWDLAAPWILVEEAGGRITDFDGRRSLERGEGLATNGRLHEAVLGELGPTD